MRRVFRNAPREIVGDVSYSEDTTQIRTDSGPQVVAALSNLGIGIPENGRAQE
jgi:hypothetical protein